MPSHALTELSVVAWLGDDAAHDPALVGGKASALPRLAARYPVPRAAAVVTDAGGILSHCAVVAREYCIPAVVATGAGTQLVPDGALVEVDGTGGTVRILEG